VDVGAQHSEHRRVLAADHATTEDGERCGDVIDLQDVVGVVDVGVLERDPGWPERARPRHDQDHVGRHPASLTAFVGHLDGARVEQPGGAVYQLDPVALEVLEHPIRLQLADGVLPLDQPRDLQLRGDVDRDAVQLPLPVARQEQRCLPERLRGKRSRMDGGPARFLPALDDRDPFAEVGGPRGSLLAGRTPPISTRS
jgi:hypothetical protein